LILDLLKKPTPSKEKSEHALGEATSRVTKLCDKNIVVILRCSRSLVTIQEAGTGLEREVILLLGL